MSVFCPAGGWTGRLIFVVGNHKAAVQVKSNHLFSDLFCRCFQIPLICHHYVDNHNLHHYLRHS